MFSYEIDEQQWLQHINHKFKPRGSGYLHTKRKFVALIFVQIVFLVSQEKYRYDTEVF